MEFNQIPSPKQQRQTLPFLLSLSFFNDINPSACRLLFCESSLLEYLEELTMVSFLAGWKLCRRKYCIIYIYDVTLPGVIIQNKFRPPPACLATPPHHHGLPGNTDPLQSRTGALFLSRTEGGSLFQSSKGWVLHVLGIERGGGTEVQDRTAFPVQDRGGVFFSPAKDGFSICWA